MEAQVSIVAEIIFNENWQLVWNSIDFIYGIKFILFGSMCQSNLSNSSWWFFSISAALFLLIAAVWNLSATHHLAWLSSWVRWYYFSQRNVIITGYIIVAVFVGNFVPTVIELRYSQTFSEMCLHFYSWLFKLNFLTWIAL